MSVSLPPCPPSLKATQHYLKLACDYEKREPVIAYWIRLYALQSSLKIDGKSKEARVLLMGLMDYLEKFKKDHAENESVTNDVAGQALVENVAHKLFVFADTEDRAAHFNKNLVKVFYSAGLLFDVCEVFGEVTEEVTAQRKYAKWKATYIHNCLKNGQIPTPGPAAGEDEGLGEEFGGGEGEQEGGAVGWSHPAAASLPPSEGPSSLPDVSSSSPTPTQHMFQPQPVPFTQPQVVQPSPTPAVALQMPEASGGVSLTPAMVTQAQKYCKWAISALDYDDSKTAISNLQKALNLLTTGRDT